MKACFFSGGAGDGSRPPGMIMLLRRTWSDVWSNEILTRAAAIAFTGMMAAIPFLALVMTIVAFLLPDQTDPGTTGIGAQIMQNLEVLLGTVFPDKAYVIIEEQIARLQSQPPLAALSLSLAITIWLASNLFASIIDGLNRIYGVEETRPYWKIRLIAAFMTIIQSVILILAVGAIFAWPVILDKVGFTYEVAWIATAAKWFIVFLMVLISFALTFFMGPDVEQSHRWVTPGSIFGAVVFLAATYGFRYYVQHVAQYDAMYGSLGGVMILMFWFWINSLVLLMAAQLNKVFHYRKQWSACERLGHDSKECQDQKLADGEVSPDDSQESPVEPSPSPVVALGEESLETPAAESQEPETDSPQSDNTSD